MALALVLVAFVSPALGVALQQSTELQIVLDHLGEERFTAAQVECPNTGAVDRGAWSFRVTCDAAGVLQNLQLSTSPYNTTLPASIGALTTLLVLQLDRCGLVGEIPAAMASLTQLQRVWLYDNHLTGSLPAGLATLDSLVDIKVHNNRLDGVIPSGMSASLQTCWLAAAPSGCAWCSNPEYNCFSSCPDDLPSTCGDEAGYEVVDYCEGIHECLPRPSTDGTTTAPGGTTGTGGDGGMGTPASTGSTGAGEGGTGDGAGETSGGDSPLDFAERALPDELTAGQIAAVVLVVFVLCFICCICLAVHRIRSKQTEIDDRIDALQLRKRENDLYSRSMASPRKRTDVSLVDAPSTRGSPSWAGEGGGSSVTTGNMPDVAEDDVEWVERISSSEEES